MLRIGVAFGRLGALSVATRIEAQDPVVFGERLDLCPKQLGGHGPAGNEDDRPTLAGFDVVHFDTRRHFDTAGTQE